ncbi:MAG: hypothetical protein LUH02_07160, partial [Erysipelotrichaceae bacterium]|nr:hypothetical protein [Erysipelotrichaceae bacterium]
MLFDYDINKDIFTSFKDITIDYDHLIDEIDDMMKETNQYMNDSEMTISQNHFMTCLGKLFLLRNELAPFITYLSKDEIEFLKRQNN